jgi:hypothetical protein
MTDQLGKHAVDQISNFEGIVTRVAYHLVGCERIQLTADDDKTSTSKSEYFYDAQLDYSDSDVKLSEEPVTDCVFECGQRVRDTVTGFEGIATVVTFELYNCPSVAITDENDPDETQWFDAPRVEYVDGGVQGDIDVDEASVSETGSCGEDFQTHEERL